MLVNVLFVLELVMLYIIFIVNDMYIIFVLVGFIVLLSVGYYILILLLSWPLMVLVVLFLFLSLLSNIVIIWKKILYLLIVIHNTALMLWYLLILFVHNFVGFMIGSNYWGYWILMASVILLMIFLWIIGDNVLLLLGVLPFLMFYINQVGVVIYLFLLYSLLLFL